MAPQRTFYRLSSIYHKPARFYLFLLLGLGVFTLTTELQTCLLCPGHLRCTPRFIELERLWFMLWFMINVTLVRNVTYRG